MALLTDYGPENRVVESGLAVTYSRKLTFGSWTFAGGPTQLITYSRAWTYTRFASKQYKYVGMTKDAAEDCAEDMRDLYSRGTLISVWGGDDDEFDDVSGGVMPMAAVSVNHTDGDMYEVAISVNETDERMRIDGTITPASLFTDENDRDYDEG